MQRRILVINGHPDPDPKRLSHALVEKYIEGATGAGHEVRRIDISTANLPPVLNTDDVEGEPPASVKAAQDDITWAQHIVLIFPLWMGGPPAHLKAFFEQICRYDFVFTHKYKPLLSGRTARIVVTMSMPVAPYRLLFARGVGAFVRPILWSAGIKPTRVLALGNVDAADKASWLAKVRELGSRGK